MKRILCSLALLAVLVSCVKEHQVNKPGESFILAESEDFELEETLTKAPGSSSLPSSVWAAGDKIVVIPLGGNPIQADYEIVKYGAAPKIATFECSILELQDGASYAAYCPFSENVLRDGDLLELSFVGQKQKENNSPDHIKNFDYKYGTTVVTSAKDTKFVLKHLVGLVCIQVTVPQADVFKRLSIEASDEWFASRAELSIKKGTMTSTMDQKTCNVALDDIAVRAGEVLTVWLSVLPTRVLEGQPVTVTLIGDKTISSAEISDFKAIESGKAYTFVCAPAIKEDVEYRKVDLGLSVNWASCNLGASSPEEFGDFYAWDEIETKYNYSLDSYNSYKAETMSEREMEGNKGYIKYIPQSKADSYGFRRFYDNKAVLDPEDDIVHITLKGNWRMPRKEEFDELIANCKCEWVSFKGVNGTKFTSKVEGYTDKWIFLPAAGYSNGTHLFNAGNYGSYWSASLYNVYPDYAHYLYLNSDYVCTLNYNRYYGQTIRPVCD